MHTIYHIVHGVAHNENGPARLEFSSEEVKVYEEWAQYGLTHRENGPAVQSWNDAGTQITEEWQLFGRLHRVGGPALRRWNDDGCLTHEIWSVHSKLHREDGPAYIKLGAISEQVWMQNGVEFRQNGLPTEVIYRDNRIYEKWQMHPQFGAHRVGGPYIICEYEAEWWYKDRRYSFEEYWLLPENCILNREKVEVLSVLPLPVNEEILQYFWPDRLAEYAKTRKTKIV